jgi:hypothetical protein
LPAGYAEAFIPGSGQPAAMRLLIRTSGSAGPAAVWSMTMLGRGRSIPLSGEIAARLRSQLAMGLAGSLQPLGVEVGLTDWAPADASGLGDQAAVSTFRFRATPVADAAPSPLSAALPAEGDGAFALFSRGDALSALALFGGDEPPSQAVRHYAAIVDAHLQALAVTGP